MKNNIKLILLFIYLIVIKNNKGYLNFLPTISIYPDNFLELKLVKEKIKNRSKKDVEMFYLTNESVSNVFLPYVLETKDELDILITRQNYIIYFFKYVINRRRPWQMDKNIKPLNIDTAQTPAYPAGHAYQAYLLYKVLSKKYPKLKNIFFKLAIECDECRVKAGLHYPSDGVYARKLVDYYNS